uniref:Uncharacterized protein n=1 Tax=Chenopodium quinoa TaxID=63459 RepID=A0A803KX77_CHEQI
MAEEKESTSVPLSQDDPEDPAKAPLTSSNSSSREGRQYKKRRIDSNKERWVQSANAGLSSVLLRILFIYPNLLVMPNVVFIVITHKDIGIKSRDPSLSMLAGEGLALGHNASDLQPVFYPCTNIYMFCQACCYVLQSWISKKFMTGCVVLFPVAVTFFITWWFIQFVDGFFSPLYESLGIDIFGLGFITSLLFVFLIGVFVSSWMGATVFWLGEWLIKKMPFVRHIYSASKQISSAISPDQNTTAFKEVAIIRHPREGEYAFGFITSSVTLQKDDGDEELCSVYVPTNHLYIGDIFLVNSKDVIRPNLSIREGIGLFSVSLFLPVHI